MTDWIKVDGSDWKSVFKQAVEERKGIIYREHGKMKWMTYDELVGRMADYNKGYRRPQIKEGETVKMDAGCDTPDLAYQDGLKEMLSKENVNSAVEWLLKTKERK